MQYTITMERPAGRAWLPRLVIATVVVAGLLVAATPAHAARFAVNSAADTDDGACERPVTGFPLKDCTLREAINVSNATDAADTISFDIPGSGVRTIELASDLPKITNPLTIDGYTQDGASPNTLEQGNNAVLLVELTGREATTGTKGLFITASDSRIRGLAINSFAVGQGIVISGPRATNNTVEGNFIGTDATGTGAAGIGMTGVHLSLAPANTVGGTTPAARNVISGNSTGVLVRGPGAGGNVLLGNFVGTDRTGTDDLGNTVGVDVRTASNITVGGTGDGARNVISGNIEAGVRIVDGTSNSLAGNFVGTDASGTQALPNDIAGVSVQGPNNTVGGTEPGAGNILSGNSGAGLFISGDDNRVQGNSIGTNVGGTQALGNDDDGVVLNLDASGNTVGGTQAGAGNVISGNTGAGVSVFAGKDNEVKGNLIGTDATGSEALGNAGDGVALGISSNVFGGISDATGNVIGGPEPGAGNVISGNLGDGVSIFGIGDRGNKVQGNLIGTRKDGTGPLGNSGSGVILSASDNVVGGTVPGTANTIAFNGEDGATMLGNDANEGAGNRILRNSIFANAGLGIDLGEDGTTSNDFGDFDSGPNGLQNFPILDSARTGTKTIIKGSLRSVPETTFDVRFFKNRPGEDEGRTFVDKRSVTTDADGIGLFTFTLKDAKRVPAGRVITATATDPGGNTSEFSTPDEVTR